MTVSAYLSPKSIIAPVLVSDVILSDASGYVGDGVATRQRVFSKSWNCIQNRLARKNVISDLTAISFAGNLDTISDFLEYCDLAIGSPHDERPLRALAERASQYSARNLNAFALTPDVDKNILHKVKPDAAVEHERDGLGFFSAIGSGSRWVIDEIDQILITQEHSDYKDYELALVVANDLCASSIIEEVYSESRRDESWGGFLEYIYFNPVYKKWCRQPSTVFFIYQLNANGEGGPNLIDRMFFYEPGSETGWLHALRSSPHHAYNLTYRLPSLCPKNNYVQSFEWWSWIPEQICLIMVSGEVEGRVFTRRAAYSRSFPLDEFNGVEKGWGRTGLRLVPFGDRLEDFLVTVPKLIR